MEMTRNVKYSEAEHNFKSFGKEDAPVVMLIPGLGVSYEIFLPLIDLLKDHFQVVAMEVDGFVLPTINYPLSTIHYQLNPGGVSIWN